MWGCDCGQTYGTADGPANNQAFEPIAHCRTHYSGPDACAFARVDHRPVF